MSWARSLPARLGCALDMLVLEQRPDGHFRRRGPLPAWGGLLRSPALLDRRGVVVPGEVFPFLTAFLPEAERVWQGGPEAPGRAWSELWTETTTTGEELRLEAAALRVGTLPLLVIRRNERLFAQQRLMLQRARELRMAHEALTRELEQKDVLVHCVVHDLASPLHSVLGALSMLLEKETEAPEGERAGERRHWLQVALEAAVRQREMISDILGVFAAEQGALDASLDPTAPMPELVGVMAQVRDELEAVARPRGVRLDVPPCSAGVRMTVIADESRLFRVLANLIRNAIAHSPPGGTVWIDAEHDAAGVRVVVDDEGPGVAPGLVPRLFEKFARGTSGGGTGLGLYFCRITVERWGGSIGYQPRPGGGARFWIRLREQQPIGGAVGRQESRDGQVATRG